MSNYFDVLNRQGRRIGAAPADLAAERPPGYETLVERLLLAANGNPLRVLAFAGCEGGEGCTSVVRGYAEMLAATGFNVLLVDADLRTRALTEHLGVRGMDVLAAVAGNTTPAAVARGKGQLTVVGSPGSGTDQALCFQAPAFATWMETQRGRYDYVLLDVPPLLRFAEGTHVGRHADGVVVVVRADSTNRELLVRARDQLTRAGVHVIGVVLNRMRDPVPVGLRWYLQNEIE
jgi:Mrp family chromosome partitioning ATPase